MPEEHTLYGEVIDITRDYLGPAAERFVDRQIISHLNKEPSSIERDDIPTLTKWTTVVFAILTEDKETVDEYSRRLEELYEAQANGTHDG